MYDPLKCLRFSGFIIFFFHTCDYDLTLSFHGCIPQTAYE